MKTKNYPSPEIGRRLENVMYEKQLSDRQLAEIVGVGRKSIMAYRNGDVAMNINVCMRICVALGITPNYLLFGKE